MNVKAEICPACGVRANASPTNGTSKVALLLITFFLGSIGGHKFYQKKYGLGILYLLFCVTGIPSIVALIEFFIYCFKSEEELQKNYPECSLKALVIAIVLSIAGITIVGILAAIVMPQFSSYRAKADNSAAITLLKESAVKRETSEKTNSSALKSSNSKTKVTNAAKRFDSVNNGGLLKEFLEVGDEGRDGGELFTLQEWGESFSLPNRRGGKILPRSGAKFIYTRIDFFNDGFESVDIHCSFDLGEALYDESGRKFDAIDSMYNIDGNTGCNDNIPPGFGSKEILAFEMPVDAKPHHVKYWDPNDGSHEESDSFGEKSAVYFLLE